MSRRRVLVVEDSAALGSILAETLTHHGLDARWAATGVEAAELAASWRPDVVLLDLHLPDGDVAPLVARLREASVRVVGMSGREIAPDERASFDGFLPKPAAVADVLAEVRR